MHHLELREEVSRFIPRCPSAREATMQFYHSVYIRTPQEIHNLSIHKRIGRINLKICDVREAWNHVYSTTSPRYFSVIAVHVRRLT